MSFSEHLYDVTTDGYIQFLKINSKNIKIYNTQYKGIRDIVEEVKGDNDIFVTPNTMYKPSRCTDNIRQFRALYIDIDGIEGSNIYVSYEVFALADSGAIPKPSMIVNSGRGIHLYWRINNAPYGALATWQELEDYLYKKLKYLGADIKATDGARVLRLPGTYNSRNNSLCRVLYIDDELTYSMYDLREKYLNYSFKKHQLEFQQTKKSNKTVINNKFFNSYSLHIARIQDILTLCKIRKYRVNGYRNFILHCYAYWEGIYLRDYDELYNVVIELNNSFTEPLKLSEVKSILRCVPKAIERFIAYEQGLRSGEDKRVSKGMRDKEGYWYKNETLIERLDITQEEQKHLKTIISSDEKYKRNNERRRKTRRGSDGLTQRERKKLELIEKVKALFDEGLKQVEIAKKLGISKGRVSQILNLKKV